MDYRLALLTGVDFPIPECQIIIHQPTLKEISLLGETDFFLGARLLTLTKKSIAGFNEQVLQELIQISDFALMLEIIEKDKKKDIVLNVLKLFFPQYKINLTPRSFIFSESKETIITIDENNYGFIRNTINQLLCLNESDNKDFNPQGKKAKEIAQKLYRARERVAAQKAKENNDSSLGQYISILTVALGSMSLQNVINLTIYQMRDLIERYGLYVNYDLDIKARLAGSTSDKQPENWMKSIH